MAKAKATLKSSPSIGRDEEKPLVLTATIQNTQQVTAVNEAARQNGLSPGMTLSHARALIPDIQTAAADPEADRIGLARLADWCCRYSPSFGIDGHDGLWIDGTGCAHLFGGEAAMLDDLGRRLNGFGLRHGLGIAPTPGAAWAVARYGREGGGARSVAADHVHEALMGLPVAGLRLQPEMVTLLRRLGLKTIGELAALPRAALGKRFSSKDACESVLLRLDQAFGRLEEPLCPRQPLPIYRVEQTVPEPIIDLPVLTHGLMLLTADLCRMLDKAGQGAERIAFLAFRVDGDVRVIRIGASQATHDAAHINRLFAEKLETIDPGFGIDKLALHAERTARIEARQRKFTGDTTDLSSRNDRLFQLIDRLANRLGPDKVTVTIPVASHTPEQASKRERAMGQAAFGRPPDGSAEPPCPPRPSCLLLRPEPIKALAEVPDGPPLRFTWRRVTHRVVKSEGPERIAGDWFGGVGTGGGLDLAAETRDYYRVEDEQGRRYWLFRQGLYDTAGYSDTPAVEGEPAGRAAPAEEDMPADRQVTIAGRSRPGWYIHGVFG